jgi:hypothetical protein
MTNYYQVDDEEIFPFVSTKAQLNGMMTLVYFDIMCFLRFYQSVRGIHNKVEIQRISSNHEAS